MPVKDEATKEKSVVNFFNLVGIIIVFGGFFAGLNSTWTALITNVSFGFILIGIGEVLRTLHKIKPKE